MRTFYEPRENAALINRPCCATSLAQLFELTLKRSQLSYPPADMVNVLFEKCIDVATVVVRPVLELKKHPDLIKRHVQAAAVADELQPLQVNRLIQPEIPGGPCRWRQQRSRS